MLQTHRSSSVWCHFCVAVVVTSFGLTAKSALVNLLFYILIIVICLQFHPYYCTHTGCQSCPVHIYIYEKWKAKGSLLLSTPWLRESRGATLRDVNSAFLLFEPVRGTVLFWWSCQWCSGGGKTNCVSREHMIIQRGRPWEDLYEPGSHSSDPCSTKHPC